MTTITRHNVNNACEQYFTDTGRMPSIDIIEKPHYGYICVYYREWVMANLKRIEDRSKELLSQYETEFDQARERMNNQQRVCDELEKLRTDVDDRLYKISSDKAPEEN